jgi:hypothetical protein
MGRTNLDIGVQWRNRALAVRLYPCMPLDNGGQWRKTPGKNQGFLDKK